MSSTAFMDRVRSFFGLRPEPPRNDFRNPIWGSDDDDDGDELYTRQQIDAHDSLEMHRQFFNHMQDMLRNFGSLFGDMKAFVEHGDIGTITEFPISEKEPDNFDSNRIRDYYLKPGYHDHKYEHSKDSDLDGISLIDISDMLQHKDEIGVSMPQFDSKSGPGYSSFCKTIITTSITKPDGTIETRRIIKNGNDVVEETTVVEPDAKNAGDPGIYPLATTNFMFSQLSSFLRNLH